MKFVTRLKTIEEAKKLDQLGIDIFCLDTDFTAKRITRFTFDEIEAITKEYPQRVYLLLNQMVHDSDIPAIEDFFIKIKDLEVSGLVIYDLTIYVIAKKLGLENLIIYQPGTMNTDTYSKVYFEERNLKGITISRELTLKEINKFNNLGLELSIIGHGYLDMFYSKRKLIKNYLIHKGIKGLDLHNNYKLFLNEEIRKLDNYPILEDKFGTHIFRSKKLISYDELNKLESIIDDFFIERIFIDDEELFSTIRLYKNTLDYDKYRSLYTNFDSGIYYKNTEKIKGERNET